LKLSKLRAKVPKSLGVVEIRVGEYVDTSGEDALRVTVILDENVEVEELQAEDLTTLTREIRKRIRDQCIELWPYIEFAKQSELDEEDEEGED
jgi:cell division GTPase FtsZ